MDVKKTNTKIAGALILLGIVVGILSVVPAVEGADYLSETAAHQSQVLIGALCQFLLVPIYIGFALLLYPMLKQYRENLAIGFVGFRIISGVFQLIGVILLPLFLLLSQQFLQAQASDLGYFELIGELLRLGRDLANHLGVMLATGLGNLMFYYILYKTKWVPRWLSSWGLLGNSLAMLASFLILFGLIDVISSEFAVMTIPLVLQELVLAIWLLRKGFDITE